jgi:hypothetical protein
LLEQKLEKNGIVPKDIKTRIIFLKEIRFFSIYSKSFRRFDSKRLDFDFMSMQVSFILKIKIDYTLVSIGKLVEKIIIYKYIFKIEIFI